MKSVHQGRLKKSYDDDEERKRAVGGTVRESEKEKEPRRKDEAQE